MSGRCWPGRTKTLERHTSRENGRALRIFASALYDTPSSERLSQPALELRSVRAAQCQLAPIVQNDREVAMPAGPQLTDAIGIDHRRAVDPHEPLRIEALENG